MQPARRPVHAQTWPDVCFHTTKCFCAAPLRGAQCTMLGVPPTQRRFPIKRTFRAVPRKDLAMSPAIIVHFNQNVQLFFIPSFPPVSRPRSTLFLAPGGKALTLIMVDVCISVSFLMHLWPATMLQTCGRGGGSVSSCPLVYPSARPQWEGSLFQALQPSSEQRNECACNRLLRDCLGRRKAAMRSRWKNYESPLRKSQHFPRLRGSVTFLPSVFH